MSIEQDISRWDGKSAEDIKVVFELYRELPDFADRLVELLHDESLQKGASWLLKALLESGHALTPIQEKVILSMLAEFENWETKLHILQCLPYMRVDQQSAQALYYFLRSNLDDDNKFVRAWSYNGFYELSRQYPEYAEETRQYFDLAMRDEAASVKARIRNILKKGFPPTLEEST